MTTRVPLGVTVWTRLSLFGGVFEAKVDSSSFNFQVPAEVSSAGCAASNTVTNKDSADARMRAFRAFIDHLPDLWYGNWAPARGAEYTPLLCVGVRSASAPQSYAGALLVAPVLERCFIGTGRSLSAQP